MRVREHEKEATDLMQKTMVDKKTITTLREVGINGYFNLVICPCQWGSITSGLYVNGDFLLLDSMSIVISHYTSLCQWGYLASGLYVNGDHSLLNSMSMVFPHSLSLYAHRSLCRKR